MRNQVLKDSLGKAQNADPDSDCKIDWMNRTITKDNVPVFTQAKGQILGKWVQEMAHFSE